MVLAVLAITLVLMWRHAKRYNQRIANRLSSNNDLRKTSPESFEKDWKRFMN